MALVVIKLTSCSPAKKFNKFLKEHPEFVKHDTTSEEKTFVKKGETDSATGTIKTIHDTIRIVTNNIVEKTYWKNGNKDSIKTEVDVLPDTIKEKVPVSITNIQPSEEKKQTQLDRLLDRVEVWGIIILAFLLLIKLLEFIKK